MRIFIGGDFCPENRAENKLIKNEDLFEGKLKKNGIMRIIVFSI